MFPLLLLFTILAIFIIYSIHLIVKRKKYYDNYNRLFIMPPIPSPIFGHATMINSTKEVLDTLTGLFGKFGNNINVIVGPPLLYVFLVFITADYKVIEFILTSNKTLKKSQNYKYLQPWLGKGLLLGDGNYWRKHRKVLTPAFHFEILKNFVAIFESLGDTLVENLQVFDGNRSFDIHPIITLYTLDVICETAMGTKINAQNGKNPSYVNSVKKMLTLVFDRTISPLKLTNYTYWMTKDYYTQKKVLKILHGFTRDVLESNKGKNLDSLMKKTAFLDLLLKYSKNGEVFSDEEIREEVDTFMFEGHDTTAAGICYTLLCLGENPEVQEKVYQEQLDLFGNEKNPKINYSDLQNMKYLDIVLKESFRLYPPVPIIGRYLEEKIDIGGCILPKGSNLILAIYHLHRNPEYFPEPEKFIPERFNSIDGPLPYAYIPFSAGQRNCIGQKFAMLEIKSAVSKVIRNFEIIKAIPAHTIELAVEGVLKSQNGIKIGLKKRN